MIYLDNCATTAMRKEVIEEMVIALEEDFGNPSSLHKLGFNVEKKITNARKIISDYLKVNEKEIYFTSGGTESNNLAIGSAINKMKNRGRHIITTKIEHPSVLAVFKNLEKQGYKVSYLGVDKYGYIDLTKLSEIISDETILVSIMQVNNELGSIENIDEIGNIIKAKNPEIIFHVDGVQGFGKIEFNLRKSKLDLYSFSSHKIHGPKGMGGLYINEKLKLEPVVFGGNQERGFRSGTENAPSIIGFGKAVEIMKNNFEEESSCVKMINSYFREKVAEIEDIRINTSRENSSPYIINLSINNIRGEVLVHYLEQSEIFVSTSSACSSNDTKKSHVLQSIGLDNKEIEGSIRVCFSHDISKEDIDKTIDEMKKAVEEIREIIMR